ncbi:MAG: hypothetical protein PHX61_02450 [Alphaproteobacteria bacterium]|nr:hypothetical protein [Alphaproteobacteria bacterium]
MTTAQQEINNIRMEAWAAHQQHDYKKRDELLNKVRNLEMALRYPMIVEGERK